MKKENIIKDLSIFNINTYSHNYNKSPLPQTKKYPDIIHKFSLECVIGKGGFGKVSYFKINNK